ncbi:MAG TPA: aminotransferase class V-fold PLP-dependent enzyme [Segetibacter sp.]|jgi:isopenicillin-N epimerase
MRDHFLLRDDITFLNFGSFGACPKAVFKRYQEFQLELEQEPVQFVTVHGPKYLKDSRNALATYLNADSDDLVYVTNPTFAVNIIAKSFPLEEGDEVLSTNIEYGSCDRTWNYYCKKARAIFKRQPIRFPIESKEDFIHQFSDGITARTKLIFISHITSSTGLRFPVEEICWIAKQKGILILIDGAHAPGQIPADLKALDVDMYTGACHKWMMTPKGCSFLYVKKELQHLFDPLVISWGYEALFPSDSQFLDYHQMNGTRDFSAFLTVPHAIEFMQENNWDKISEDCRKLVKENAPELCRILNTAPISPLTDDFVLQLFSAPIKTSEPENLKQHLYEKYKIEIPVMRQNENVYLRYSINAFNTQADLDKLFSSVKKIQSETNLIEA